MTNDMIDEEIEHRARALGDDISLLLDEQELTHEVHIEWDGDDGWHVVITAGHAVHGSPLREYTLTYATADQRWTCQTVDEDGTQAGPHEVPGSMSPVEAAVHIAAEIGGAR